MVTETRIRKIYQPLSLSISIKTEGEVTAQQYNQYENTITPERSEENPTILSPYVWATTGNNEPSWVDCNVANLLKEVRWFANNVDITVSGTSVYDAWHKAGSALFEVVSSDGDNNGSLRIWKNFAAEERYTMRMEAKFIDPRTGQIHYVKTDGIDMQCQAKGESEWDFSVVHDVNVRYCPVYDKLKLYDWLVSKGEHPNKADYTDETGYDLSMPLLITHGHNKVTPDSHIRFRILDHLNSHTEVTPDNRLYLKEVDGNHLRFDLRFMPEDTLVLDVQMLIDGVLQSQEQLTFTRYYPVISVQTTNLTDIDLNAATRRDKALVLFNGNKVEYPEAYLRLVWSARVNESDPWTPQGIGESVIINQSSLKPKDNLFIRIDYGILSGLAPISNNEGLLITNADNKIIAAEILR